ncbi:MAG: hypothetical protein K2L48_05510 [Mycoplasmoidaceae bacterium]|nr:hypothetical protein [Mycoplasmoidaceae bacterium]
MNKKILKNILLASCGLGAITSIPVVTTSCNYENASIIPNYKEYDAKVVVDEMADQFEMVGSQILGLISSQPTVSQTNKFYAAQVLNLVSQTIIPALKDAASKFGDVYEDKDPLEIFQEVLVLFHDPIMEAVNKVASNKIVQFLFGEEKINNFVNLLDGILTKKIDLEKYAKNN